MNNREALQALIEGKYVRKPHWDALAYQFLSPSSVIMLHHADGYETEDTEEFLRAYSGWEIYTPPKPKRKFYRRKWVEWTQMGLDMMPFAFPSKEEFDRDMARCGTLSYSDVWEEVEI